MTITTAAKTTVKKILGMRTSPMDAFLYFDYLRHDQRRQEHLASLNLDTRDSTVLEVGAGIGNHTSFFLDRGCTVTSTEARPENLDVLRTRYPDLETRRLDLDEPDETLRGPFDIVYCYGVLYHLKNPAAAIKYMAARSSRLLLMETCVSYGSEEAVNLVPEPADNLSQSVHGVGCRPTRPWVFQELKRNFEFVYMPVTQPNHKEFPTDWTTPDETKPLVRSVFVASRVAIENELLVEDVPLKQRRH